MVYIAYGINHKSAPINFRERMTISPDEQAPFLREILSIDSINEAAVLSTCNRTEFYFDSKNGEFPIKWFADRKSIVPKQLKEYAYTHVGREAIKHTMRVASGLDSMVFGEPQILGQMKQAFNHAQNIGTIGHNIHTIFRHVFKACKKVRTDTNIGVNSVSIAFAAVNLIKQQVSQLSSARVLLIGAGETASLAAHYLQDAGVKTFLVANRTLENASLLASELSGTALTIGDIPHTLSQADIVISATACPLPFISKSLVERIMASRQGKKMFFLDLAVPRDIEHEVSTIENVHLYNIDDMETVVNNNLENRLDATTHAEKIIELAVDDYMLWQKSLNARDAIRYYRNTAKSQGNVELERALRKLQTGKPAEDVLKEFNHRMIQKLAHQPTEKLYKAGINGNHDILKLINHLFS